MIVVGGIYGELCHIPALNQIVGSGLRAAGALATAVPGIQLYGAVEKQSTELAQAVAASLSVSLTLAERSEPVSFDYYTPLSDPGINGRLATVDCEIDAESDAALVFGMLEAKPRVSADRMVLDPQQPRDLTGLDLSRLSFNQLAICANVNETLQIGGRKSVHAAARQVLKRTGATVVVTKCGPLGSIVTTTKGHSFVGPSITKSVSPIGTGDVYAAAFAYAWAAEKLSPLKSARLASRAAASWAVSESMPLDFGEGSQLRNLRLAPFLRERPRVYLAGPYFSLGQKWLIDLLLHSLSGLGARVNSPFHEIGPGGDEVARMDLRLLEHSDSVLAVLDDRDPGTLFEVGWATRKGIPVVGLAADKFGEWRKMITGTGTQIYDDLSTAAYAAIWRGAGL